MRSSQTTLKRRSQFTQVSTAVVTGTDSSVAGGDDDRRSSTTTSSQQAVPANENFIQQLAKPISAELRDHFKIGTGPKARQFLKDFISTFESKKYEKQLLQAVLETHEETADFTVTVFDVIQYSKGSQSTANEVSAAIVRLMLSNTRRFVLVFTEVGYEILTSDTYHATLPSRERSLLEKKLEKSKKITKQPTVEVSAAAPFRVFVEPPTQFTFWPSISLRELPSRLIGSLVSINCQVVRVSRVSPRLEVAAFECQHCRHITYLQTSRNVSSLTPVSHCSVEGCVSNNLTTSMILRPASSRFVAYQTAIVQELSGHIPHGDVPRNLKIILEGSNARKLVPGNITTINGIFLPAARRKKQAFFQSKGALTMGRYIEAHSVIVHKSTTSNNAESSEEWKKADKLISSILEGPPQSFNLSLYEQLTDSIAPSIYGNIDLKRALVLQMLAGDTRRLADGVRLRNDIHILLMGDPGVAKSQFLHRMVQVSPRGNLTTGKGASGVGLTASVHRDPVTQEFTLEGGAIVLADGGICAIDEFDKMAESDRTAIHEVMEQQTVSIAKAGLNTTLNARTAILAAANPVSGRYDISKSAVVNIHMPAALLSRFDLQFLMLDTYDQEKDKQLAQHVTSTFRDMKARSYAENPKAGGGVGNLLLSSEEIRAMVTLLKRRIHPVLDDKVFDVVASRYAEMRRESYRKQGTSDDNVYVTPRSLLALLRIARAHARVRCSEKVQIPDIEEAVRLMDASRASVLSEQVKRGKRTLFQDTASRQGLLLMELYAISRTCNEPYLNMDDVVNKLKPKGFTAEEIKSLVSDKAELGDVTLHKGTDLRRFNFTDRLQEILDDDARLALVHDNYDDDDDDGIVVEV